MLGLYKQFKKELKMGIINQEKWDNFVKVNADDAYSKACVDVARQVMVHLDDDPTPLHKGYHPDIHTAHGLICKSDDEVGAGSISGFMAGAVRSMIKAVHSRGEEFAESFGE